MAPCVPLYSVNHRDGFMCVTIWLPQARLRTAGSSSGFLGFCGNRRNDFCCIQITCRWALRFDLQYFIFIPEVASLKAMELVYRSTVCGLILPSVRRALK